jgi:hypothetical protein
MIVILACALRGAISIFGVHAGGMRERVQRQLAARSHSCLAATTAAWQRILARPEESHKNAALLAPLRRILQLMIPD